MKQSLKKVRQFYPPKTKGKAILLGLMIFLFMVFIGVGVLGSFIYSVYKTLPSPKELCNIQPSLVTRVFAADSSLAHEFSIERRFWVSIHKIPQPLQQAVVSIEDRRFYDHWGVDIKRFFGAVIIDVVSRRYAQGASTLTQQLVKNVYFTSRQTIIRKIREILTAVKIESYYTKDEIMELYLNMVYLGAGVYGVEAASQRYFNKDVTQLTLNECATLAGCIQLPERYRPDKKDNNSRTEARRNTVLRAMRKMGYITSEQLRTVSIEPVPSNPQQEISQKAPYFIEMVRQYMEKKYGEDLLYNGGLSIYTTLNLQAQDSTDAAVSLYRDSLQRGTNALFLDSTDVHKKLGISRSFFLDNFDSLYGLHAEEYNQFPDSIKLRIVQVSVVALNVRTGAIEVMTGGRNFQESKFNRAIQALRQPGSAFKAFVYTVALEKGFTPASVVLDQPITLETPEGLWRPENYEKEFYGPVTIREAVKRSINLVAIQVLMDVGVNEVIAYARRSGLEHTLNPVPSLAIGSCEATNLEMTSAYSVYPNFGVQATPYFVEKVLDKNGRVLESSKPEFKQVVSPKIAYLMSSLLSSVVQAGTGAAVYRLGFNRPCAGKTGTTNSYSDAWFVGFTPQKVCGVWTGVDERRSMGRGVTGSKAAIPIWVKTMKELHRKEPVKGFAVPEGIVSERICNKSHKLATSSCPDISSEVFLAETLPDSCDIHGFGVTRKKGETMQRFGSDGPSENMKKNKQKLIF